MKILFISAEVAPFSKVGGMGDVCGALPRALAARGHQVLVVTPAYGKAHDHLAWDTGQRLRVWLMGETHELAVRVHEAGPGLSVALLQHPALTRGGVYGDDRGGYGDNLLRFALLSRAALDVPRVVPVMGGGPLGDVDVVHVHDWHAALGLVYLRAHHQALGLHPRARGVLTVHNAAHQGLQSPEAWAGLDLAPRWAGVMDWGGRLGLLKAGLVTADVVTAVSPSFAEELRTPEGGFGLDGLLRRVELRGVLNGIDTNEWDPTSDPHIPAHFSARDLSGKARCKAALQDELGLPQRADAPLVAVVSRLDGQKGIEAVLDVGPGLAGMGGQLVVLGTGLPKLEAGLRRLEARAPRSVRAILDFDVPLSHRIYAAADLVLVPSRFEPCGLTQMYGMRYGAVPVVRAVGGLKDTVQPWSPSRGTGTGWVYSRPDGLGEALSWALRTWRDWPEAFATVRRQGMERDWSWGPAAARYEAIYSGA